MPPRVLDLKLKHRPAAAIGIPMTEYVPRAAFWRFVSLAHHLTPSDRPMPIYETALVSEARNTLIRQFLSEPEYQHCDYLLMFDSDMTVTPDIVDIMVGRGLPFLSAYCTRKVYPYMPVPAIRKSTGTRHGEDMYQYHSITDWEPNSGIRQCDAVGAAALCVRRDVLAAIQAPWFKFEHGGEDYFFCRRVREVKTHDWPGGVPILVDTHLSVGHIGEHIAMPDDWFRVKDDYFAASGEHEITVMPDPDVDSCLSEIVRKGAHGHQEEALPVPARQAS